MLPKINLKHLVLRIKKDEKLLVEFPDKEEMIRNHMNRQKEYIIRCVMENEDNPLLEKICMK